MTTDEQNAIIAETNDIIALTFALQRSILSGQTDLNQLDGLRERLEEVWRELGELNYDRFREEHENDPFPESTETVRITTPFPPTLNHNVARNGKRYFRDKNYDAFIELVGYEWRRVQPRKWDVNRRFAISIQLFYDSKRRYDVDNRVKPILDALTKAGVWQDDSQVDDVRVTRCGIDKEKSRAEVAIIPLAEAVESAKPTRKKKRNKGRKNDRV